jgi:hypothetical protein
MRGRLYPQPRERYERFRLNPYSPLYEGLALFVSIPLVGSIRPELHGPYAPPGIAHFPLGVPVFHRFFQEIGRAAFSPYDSRGAFSWSIEIPPQEVLTLTTMVRTAGTINDSYILRLITSTGDGTASIGEYTPFCPYYFWRNVNWTFGRGYSENTWPVDTWFTFSGIFRPGSVKGYLSNWGIIDVTLLGGQWPTKITELRQLRVGPVFHVMWVSDTFVHLRELSLTELDAISDYGNVDLRVPGEAPLLLPVRTYWPSVLPVAPSYLKRRSLGARSGTREAAL